MNICRKRSLVSIGTHDLDTVQAPFTYSARVPEKIKFVPLNKTQEYDAVELFKLYESDAHLKRFLDIIRDKPVYPLVTDSNDVVLSLPPIINSNHSKITLDTKNVLIEITATDLTKANIVLNVITTMFSVYCDDKYAVEPVDIVYPNGEVQTTPDFTPRVFEVDSDYVNRLIGVDLNSSEILGYLDKAGLKGTLGKHPLAPNADSITMQGSEPIKGELISVEVPPTRADIIHSCDIIEDIAISFGYNKIPRAMIELATVGKPLPLNKLGRLIRHELAYSGFIEVLPLSLCSHDELFKMLQRKDGGNEAVVLANPMTIEYQVCRTLLLPGVLKTIRENKGIALPFKVFEVGDVVLKDSTKERMARNEKRLCVAYSNKSAKFELVQGILDRVMAMLNVSNYFLRPIDDEQNDCEGGGMYLPKRGAHIVYNDNVVLGSIGILHPNVLGNFSLEYPVSTFEINIEPFV
ncbi:Phenylalanine-tRNA ligase beta subunit [Zancudomyces culisetae]|uniref:phenylalanine--tRNA ligase n=1 Tax=Zancudomyces culisetae TaxID=1213189 RepID=A0A1R1PUL8_ZANCU|nr:Phenylalanine-tRNA ligase beta subunit [Zancudomyces culisetae]|eukprot:OMH84645.1 Phenylalanine-tRNA ligase beta subunit [Zancudomyces culisetae]